MRRNEMTFLISAVLFAFGCVVLMFGVILHDRYPYSATYTNAVHAHASAGVVMILGGAIAILGIAGIISAVLRRL